HVARDGPDDDEIEIRRLHARHLQRPLRGGGGHVRRHLTLFCDAALADAGAGEDPLVGRVDFFREIVIGHDLLRGVATRTDDPRSHHGAPLTQMGPKPQAISDLQRCSVVRTLTRVEWKMEGDILEGAAAQEAVRAWLERNPIPFEVLEDPKTARAPITL